MAARKRPTKKQPEPFAVGAWNGLPNYTCRLCGFATLDRERAVLHVIERHALKEEDHD